MLNGLDHTFSSANDQPMDTYQGLPNSSVQLGGSTVSLCRGAEKAAYQKQKWITITFWSCSEVQGAHKGPHTLYTAIVTLFDPFQTGEKTESPFCTVAVLLRRSVLPHQGFPVEGIMKPWFRNLCHDDSQTRVKHTLRAGESRTDVMWFSEKRMVWRHTIFSRFCW